jgi:hypothetical protein
MFLKPVKLSMLRICKVVQSVGAADVNDLYPLMSSSILN